MAVSRGNPSLRSVPRAGDLGALELGLEIAFTSWDMILVRGLRVHALVGRLVLRDMGLRTSLLFHAQCLLGIGHQLLAGLFGLALLGAEHGKNIGKSHGVLLLGAGEDMILFVAAMGRRGLDVLTRDGDIAGGRDGAGGIADVPASLVGRGALRSEEHTSEL